MLNSFSRRKFLSLSAGTTLGVAGCSKLKTLYDSDPSQALSSLDSFEVNENDSLKEIAKAKGITFGAAARYRDLYNHTELAAVYANQCEMLVPEWSLKWYVDVEGHTLRPAPDKFNFEGPDWMADFARQHDMSMRGHALVWHISMPPWFEQEVNQQNAESVMIDHIRTVMPRFAGVMHSWDVVNEAINVSDEQPNGLRKTPWYDFLGPDYIDIAFHTAAEADPQAILTYNDYGLCYDDDYNDRRREAVLNLLERLQSNGTPLHALGIQSHLVGDRSSQFLKFRRFLSDVADLGLEIMITELDVRDQDLPADVSRRDEIVAGVYEDFLSVALDEPAVKTVITWGLSDGYNYMINWFPREDGNPVRPLLLDDELNRKLAWRAVARALMNAPSR